VFALRVVVSIAILAVFVPRVHWAELFPEWHFETFVWLAAALLVTLSGILLSTLRWQQVVHALGMPGRTRDLLPHYFAGLFVSNVLPSTIGGDVLRVARLSTDTGERPASFASVVLERLTGWLVLPVLTLLGLLINPGLRGLGTASRLALAIAISTLVLLLVILAAAASPHLGGRLAHHPSWLRFVGAVHLGIDRFRRHPGAVASVLIAGFAYQLAVVLAAYLGSEALELDIGPTAMLAFMPVVAIAQVLPISVGGFGLRESAFYIFLNPLGVTATQAVALGLLVYLMNLVVSLLGAPAFAVGPKPTEAAQATA
jgi:uncharacterized membrane protein YbhN (UPF0104 family)